MKQAQPDRIEKLLLSEYEVAAALGIGVRLSRRWRTLSKGPRYVKLSGRIGVRGGRVAYPARDLYRWLESLPSGGSKASEGAT